MPVVPNPYQEYSVQLSGTRIVYAALRKLGSISSGEDPSADEMRDGLEALNDMIDTWNSERLSIPSMSVHSFTLTSGTQSYSIGPAADFDMFRPAKIEQGQAFVKRGDIEYPLKVTTRDEWASVVIKNLNGALPWAMFYDQDTPTGTIQFYPIPDQTYTFNLYAPTLLSQITNAGEIFYLPPAYSEALKNGLALRLWPEYPNPGILAMISELANNSKAAIKRLNSESDSLRCDEAILSAPSAGWVNSAAFKRGF